MDSKSELPYDHEHVYNGVLSPPFRKRETKTNQSIKILQKALIYSISSCDMGYSTKYNIVCQLNMIGFHPSTFIKIKKALMSPIGCAFATSHNGLL